VNRMARAVVGEVTVLLAMCAGAHAQLSAADKALFDSVDRQGVEAALQNGANIEARSPGYNIGGLGIITDAGFTPLIQAANLGYTEAVQALLEHHANIEARDAQGCTALLRAIYMNPNGSDLIQLLLANHANVEATCDEITSPLNTAAEKGKLDLVKLLIKYHADINGRNTDHPTPLMWAARGGNLEVVKLLVELGAPINTWDKDGETPLMWAVTGGDYPEVVNFLLTNHADIEARNKKGQTALFKAFDAGSADSVRVLLANHADLQSKDSELETTPLEWMAYRGDYKVIQMLFDEAIKSGVPHQPIPREARRPFMEASAVFEGAQSDKDTETAIALYEEALLQAPCYLEAWNNLSLAQEKRKQYQAAADSLKNFVKLEPGGANDQATTDRIYTLEGKAKLSVQ